MFILVMLDKRTIKLILLFGQCMCVHSWHHRHSRTFGVTAKLLTLVETYATLNLRKVTSLAMMGLLAMIGLCLPSFSKGQAQVATIAARELSLVSVVNNSLGTM